MNDAQRLRQELDELNDMLRNSFHRLRSYADDPAAAKARQSLRAFGQQIKATSDVLNRGKVKQAQAMAPTREVVAAICQQADQVFTFEDDPAGQPPTEPKSETTEETKSTDQTDESGTEPEVSDEDAEPVPRPTDASQLRQPPGSPPNGLPSNADALKAALFARSHDKDDPLTLEDVANAAAMARWVKDRRPGGRSKKRHESSRGTNQDH